MKCVYCGGEHIEETDICLDENYDTYLHFAHTGHYPHVYVCKDCGYIMIFDREKECK